MSKRGVCVICDYSLHAVRTREAVRGDILEVYQFNSSTKGMRDATEARPFVELACAVCLKEGTELRITEPVIELFRWPSWLPLFNGKRKHRHSTATFRKLGERVNEQGYGPAHRDGIEFPDGAQVLINNLEVGQIMGVLQVPAERAKEVSPLSDDWSHLSIDEQETARREYLHRNEEFMYTPTREQLTGGYR